MQQSLMPCLDPPLFGNSEKISRLQVPAILIGKKRKPKSKKDSVPDTLDDFKDHLERELKPFGSLDSRLTEDERRQLEELQRIRSALKDD